MVEGESLINDATAITAYRVAVVAVTAGTFSLSDAGGRFVIAAAGGVVIGLAVGYVVAFVRSRLDDPPVEITISLLTGYLAYLPAEQLELSGVVAAVTVGLYMGSQTSRVTNATLRMQTVPVWQILIFLLNSFLFVLIGLQLPALLDELQAADFDVPTVIGYGLLASAAVIVVRIVLGLRPDLASCGMRGTRSPAQRRARGLDGDARRGLARGRARAARPRPTPARRSPSAR